VNAHELALGGWGWWDEGGRGGEERGRGERSGSGRDGEEGRRRRRRRRGGGGNEIKDFDKEAKSRGAAKAVNKPHFRAAIFRAPHISSPLTTHLNSNSHL
jgi:hypothetical protein